MMGQAGRSVGRFVGVLQLRTPKGRHYHALAPVAVATYVTAFLPMIGNPASASTSLRPQAITFTSTTPTNAAVGGSYTRERDRRGLGPPGAVLHRRLVHHGSLLPRPAPGTAQTIRFTHPGDLRGIDANQAGGVVYSAAPQMQQSFTIIAATSTDSNPSGPSVVGQATTFSSTSSTSPHTSIPTGAISGDVLVSVINTSALTTVACPSGWTEQYQAANGTSMQLVACTYVVGSSSPTAKAALSSAAPVAMVTEAFSGVKSTDPVDAARAVSGLVSPSVSTTAAGDLLVLGEGSSTSTARPTVPSGASLLMTLSNSSISQTAIATIVSTSPGIASTATWSTNPSTSTAATGVVALVSSKASSPARSQAITFTSPSPTNATVGGSYTVSTTGGGSGHPVLFSIDASSTPGACPRPTNSATIHFTAPGLA